MSFKKTFLSLVAVMIMGAIAFGAWCGYPSLGPYVLICALAEAVGVKDGNHGFINIGTHHEFAVGFAIWFVAAGLVSWLVQTLINRPRKPE